MTLCGCGKPKSHGGMCSVRWAVRRANNGPTGIKAKEPAEGAPPMSEEAIARRLFGDLADDILLLRAHGHTVARFRDGFRVDRDVLDADRLQAKAKALRDAPAKKSRGDRAVVRNGGGDDAQLAGGEAVASVAPPAASRKVLPDSAVNGADSHDLRAGIARLEQRIDFLFVIVADAIKCRHGTLIDQAAGLAKLETTLREAR